jgi:spermidine/putrescine-binding protein
VAKVRVQSSTGTMMERISSGENLIGYNVLGSYALVRAKTDPSIGVVLPKDYTLVMSRVFFINKGAKNVNAAKLWLDYMLSHRGQTIIANDSKLFAIRADVTGETTSAELIKQIGKDKIKPVPVHPDPAAIPGTSQAHGLPEAVERNRRQVRGNLHMQTLAQAPAPRGRPAALNWPRGGGRGAGFAAPSSCRCS